MTDTSHISKDYPPTRDGPVLPGIKRGTKLDRNRLTQFPFTFASGARRVFYAQSRDAAYELAKTYGQSHGLDAVVDG